MINPEEGCRFRWRCPFAIDACHSVTPLPRAIGGAEVACHVAGDGELAIQGLGEEFE